MGFRMMLGFSVRGRCVVRRRSGSWRFFSFRTFVLVLFLCLLGVRVGLIEGKRGLKFKFLGFFLSFLIEFLKVV